MVEGYPLEKRKPVNRNSNGQIHGEEDPRALSGSLLSDEIAKRRPGRYECSPFINGANLDGSSLPQNLGSGQRIEPTPRSWGWVCRLRSRGKMKGKLGGGPGRVYIITMTPSMSRVRQGAGGNASLLHERRLGAFGLPPSDVSCVAIPR